MASSYIVLQVNKALQLWSVIYCLELAVYLAGDIGKVTIRADLARDRSTCNNRIAACLVDIALGSMV